MKLAVRKIMIGICGAIFLIGSITLATSRNDTVQRFFRDISIKFNGSIITPKDANGKVVEPFIIDGTTYLPVRAVGEAMGLDVDWDDSSSTVVLRHSQENHRSVKIDDENTFEERLTTNIWSGSNQKDVFVLNDVEDFRYITEVVSYEDYLKHIQSVNDIFSSNIIPKYIDESKNYAIILWYMTNGLFNVDLIDYEEKSDRIMIYGDEDYDYVAVGGTGVFIAIPTEKPVGTPVDFIECKSPAEIEEMVINGVILGIEKPIIYLYPTEETEVSVKLLKAENLTCSYPGYENQWKVTAQPDGNMVDLKTGRNLYSLYYESKNDDRFEIMNEGFIVRRENIAKFLEEKLAILGLSEREAEEFIIYWLPKLEENPYNYIRFASMDEINKRMPLAISPEPDTTIRVLMTYKGLENPIEVEEQKLETPERTGFVAVEWGGTEI